ncbi:MAG: hypothetical protein ACTHMS_01345 [Jatrophihabitans sp.]|uniref:hypothetical protein n=1 Tax=Jatrophihabitans sp. TaxID=1932789 RepID=UPI003F7D6277
MGGEIELISDGQGLLLRGDPADIESFLEEQSLPANWPATPKLNRLLPTMGAAVQAGGQISAESGRWLKLTKESAAKIKSFGGLTKTGEAGISYAMIGKAGASKSWLKVVNGPGTKLTNPAVLTNVGAMMTQLAMQQAIDEIKDYLVVIDEKVDDVLRAQKDAMLADMIGVGLVLDEAMVIREHTGHVSEVTWSKVQTSPQILASVQAYALRQIDALVDKIETKPKLRDVAESVAAAEPKVREWLAVLARSFQLQDAFAVLEIERVLDVGSEALDRHRAGLLAARQRRLDAIAHATDDLLHRLAATLGLSNSKVLFHPGPAALIARAGTSATKSVVTAREVLGIESAVKPFESTTWAGAARQLARSAREAGSEGLGTAREIGDRARDAAFDRGDRVAAAYARRSAERRAKSAEAALDEPEHALLPAQQELP